MESLWKDLLVALRSLRKRPGFALVISSHAQHWASAQIQRSSACACGVACAPAISRAGQIGCVVGQERQEEPDAAAGFVSKPQRLEGTESVFEQMAGMRGESFSLTDRNEPERVSGLRVSVNILSLLGAEARAGPRFSAGRRTAGTRSRRAGRPHVMATALRRRSAIGRADIDAGW